MLKLDLSRESKRFLDALPAKQFRQVVNKILALLVDLHVSDSIHLKGYNLRRVDMGEYRIVYQLEKDCVKIYCIGKRNDSEIYKNIKK